MKASYLQVKGYPVLLYGANLGLLAWASSSNMAKKALGVGANGLFRKDTDLYETLFACLSHGWFGIIESATFIKRLWSLHPELGPCPLIDELKWFQFEGYFYTEYRDHVAHQLKVLLLGMMLYDTCPELKKAIHEDIFGSEWHHVNKDQAEAEFMLRWLLTAVYHDIGYVLENEQGTDAKRQREGWGEIQTTLNAMLAYPVAYTSLFSNVSDLATLRTSLTNWHSDGGSAHPQAPVTVQTSEDLFRYRGVNLLEKINDTAKAIGLISSVDNETSPGFKRYYDLAREVDIVTEEDKRPTYLDHGITSAGMLFILWKAYKEQIGYLAKETQDAVLVSQIVAPLVQGGHLKRGESLSVWTDKLNSTEPAVLAAAGAIACHNIRRDIWKGNEAHLGRRKLFLSGFVIPRKGDEAPTSLAFLLRVADTLQDWGRPRFRVRRNDDLTAYDDGDMSIVPDTNGIRLFFFKDAGNSQERCDGYKNAHDELRKSLSVGDLEQTVGLNTELVGIFVKGADDDFVVSPFQPGYIPYSEASAKGAASVGPAPEEKEEEAVRRIQSFLGLTNTSSLERKRKCPFNQLAMEYYAPNLAGDGGQCALRWRSLHLLAKMDLAGTGTEKLRLLMMHLDRVKGMAQMVLHTLSASAATTRGNGKALAISAVSNLVAQLACELTVVLITCGLATLNEVAKDADDLSAGLKAFLKGSLKPTLAEDESQIERLSVALAKVYVDFSSICDAEGGSGRMEYQIAYSNKKNLCFMVNDIPAAVRLLDSLFSKGTEETRRGVREAFQREFGSRPLVVHYNEALTNVPQP